MELTTDKPSREDIQRAVDRYRWFHSMDFGDGVQAKGDKSLDLLARHFAAFYDCIDLKGRTLLDVGAWSGGYSFEAKKRGAARVVATDDICWNFPDRSGRDGFELARKLTGLQIEAKDIDVALVTPQTMGVFDVVLFSGVFYHLLTPLHVTRQIASCATHLLILETHQDFLDSDRPGMVMYPGDILNNDESNWWGPNPRAVYTLLKEFGFARIFYQDTPECADPSQPNFRGRGLYHAFRSEESLQSLVGVRKPRWHALDEPAVQAEIFRPLPNVADAPRAELEAMRAEIEAMRRSLSWRITAPLRHMRRILGVHS